MFIEFKKFWNDKRFIVYNIVIWLLKTEDIIVHRPRSIHKAKFASTNLPEIFTQPCGR
jgi:hypothetical protein